MSRYRPNVKTTCESSLRILNPAASEIYLRNVVPFIETLELGLKRLAIRSEPFEAVPMRCLEKTDAYVAEVLRFRKRHGSRLNANNIFEPTSTLNPPHCLCSFTADLLGCSFFCTSQAFLIRNEGGGKA
jgi:hypothetical protein